MFNLQYFQCFIHHYSKQYTRCFISGFGKSRLLSENEKLREIPLQEPLTNILSSIEDLNNACVKINEIQDLIKQERRSEHFKFLSTTWSSVVLTMVVMLTVISSSCCCKCCRQCAFWMWDKWTPKECIRNTRERYRLITNINTGKVTYQFPRPHHLLHLHIPYPKHFKNHKHPQAKISNLDDVLSKYNWELTELRKKANLFPRGDVMKMKRQGREEEFEIKKPKREIGKRL